MRYDLVLITTVEAKSMAAAESFLTDFADGLADENHAPFTTIGYTNDVDNEGQRVIYLHSLDKTSEYDGPLQFGPK